MQSSVSFDVILHPEGIKFFQIRGWLLFEQELVSLCQKIQIKKIIFDYDVTLTSSHRDLNLSVLDGVAMGSSLGPSLANIFVGYHEALLFKRVNKPLMYYRYVDDTFAVFNDEDKCNKFFSHLNSLHPSLRFTFERNAIGLCPFSTSW